MVGSAGAVTAAAAVAAANCAKRGKDCVAPEWLAWVAIAAIVAAGIWAVWVIGEFEGWWRRRP